ncbi:snoRNP protein GAR1 [Staphylothermus marinus F1]|uniref:snoRNP protein GAR1 n=1 Tax=Staphylothermus marinus (strain ATCC 43588 / DSM 3639 / JCM 9404 / F1) TaxID=399550 RepID=A3DNY1_STAMF|nr:snoRNP protein GAR1 [Staphylothermus marinus]ABN70341.1 snoRNP protein GAR1 [Staphylothermus marinus F1]
MKKLGEIVTKTKDNLLIVKSYVKDPRRLVGALVYDSSLRRIGRIVDVIGRVDQPHVVVKPESKEILDFIDLGITYYYVKERKRSSRQTRGKGKKKRGGKSSRRGRGRGARRGV